jgi:cytochrome P450/NADPH-cytochrome P450 reductase
VFSRAPEHDWKYVQDRITAEGEQIWQLLESDAHVYVCGDGNTMAPDVRQAFTQLYTRFADATPDAAAKWWQRLCDTGRYVEDVYIR